MQKIKRAPFGVVITAVVVCLSFGLAACSPQAASSAPPASSSVTASESGVYVSDEQCLSCHGESHEALAKTTEILGDWNPHDPIHGGYNSCNNCHAKDKEITNNYCESCHAYAPAKGAA